MKLSLERAVVVAAILVTVAIIWVGRWEVTGVNNGAYRLDRWTGTIAFCAADFDEANAAAEKGAAVILRCSPLTDEEKSAIKKAQDAPAISDKPDPTFQKLLDKLKRDAHPTKPRKPD